MLPLCLSFKQKHLWQLSWRISIRTAEGSLEMAIPTDIHRVNTTETIKQKQSFKDEKKYVTLHEGNKKWIKITCLIPKECINSKMDVAGTQGSIQGSSYCCCFSHDSSTEARSHMPTQAKYGDFTIYTSQVFIIVFIAVGP